MLRQNLSQKMMQKLSPQQIQLMKLLQIPTATLDQRIKEELESNPALDEGDEANEVYDLDSDSEETTEEEYDEPKSEDFELDDYIKEYIEDDPISYKIKNESIQDIEEKTMPIAVQNSFHEYLDKQLGMLNIESEKEQVIAEQIIGSIDSDGYLRREPIAIIDDLLFTSNIDATEEEIESVLMKVQNLEPAGVGARSLQESLILQINDKLEKEPEEHKKARSIALKILLNHFDQFTKKHYQKLQKNLFLSESELKEAIEEILKLNPKPASGFYSPNTQGNQYIVPDFIISNRDGELELILNSKNAPDLRINDHYLEMLKSYKDSTKGRRAVKKEKEAVMFIKQKIDSAKWFIDAIKQRQETLHNTMYSIMQFQYDFFQTGDERRLKPMILKDISEITGLDISTISRVANSKFVQTEFGTKRLKDFFSESITTQDGKEVSTLEVKNILRDIIDNEDKKKPASDEKLKESLQNKGYNIARRTVAKYREQLSIPVARLRKEL
ncbi:MAG: RNA polymerase factor sigma-54 [Saprospiraceae bacterium]|nr:RNA polymerase factor sigma-54 [Bacteroidia bacterium]NNE14204.1 RNA polymerase factor sigma-54 [Saprospiraceae bacterium]NNL91653.1 RNA polymerase factor sigma-54 [Saprospiraceae bacterium]